MVPHPPKSVEVGLPKVRRSEASHVRNSGSPLRGIVTALVTPLTVDLRLDVEAFDRLISNQIAAGVNGVFVLGSVGEGPLLPDDVCDEVVTRAVERIGAHCAVLAGASDNSVVRCLARLERLAKQRVQYGVVTLPYYGWPGRVSDSVEFFATLASRSPLPLVAYNLPKAVGWQMPVAALEELFQIPNLVCLKDTHGDFDKMAAVAESPRRPAHFTYLPGNSLLATRLIRRGADGVVSTPSNLFPELFVTLWRLCEAGQWARIEQLDQTLLPTIVRLLDLMPTGAASIKGLLHLRGICSRYTMRPWPEASESDLQTMREALVQAEAALTAQADLLVDGNA